MVQPPPAGRPNARISGEFQSTRPSAGPACPSVGGMETTSAKCCWGCSCSGQPTQKDDSPQGSRIFVRRKSRKSRPYHIHRAINTTSSSSGGQRRGTHRSALHDLHQHPVRGIGVLPTPTQSFRFVRSVGQLRSARIPSESRAPRPAPTSRTQRSVRRRWRTRPAR